MRDWSGDKSIALAVVLFGGVVEAKKLVDAIAEIEQLRIKHDNQLQYSVLLGVENEQLRQDKTHAISQVDALMWQIKQFRQDKAELVEMCKTVLSSIVAHPKYLEGEHLLISKLEKAIIKHGGEQNESSS